MNRRDFIRQGSLWVAGALVVEPVVKRLWAFPTNPLGHNQKPLGLIECLELKAEYAPDVLHPRLRLYRNGVERLISVQVRDGAMFIDDLGAPGQWIGGPRPW